MTITEIIMTASEFRTLIVTLEKRISLLDQEGQAPEELRQEGIGLTGVLQKMASANASYVIRCKTAARTFESK